KINGAEAFVLFHGATLGNYQQRELGAARGLKLAWVRIGDSAPDPHITDFWAEHDPIGVPRKQPTNVEAIDCARNIVRRFGIRWIPPDDIPLGYPFDYEKDIVQAYRRSGEGREKDHRVPPGWP